MLDSTPLLHHFILYISKNVTNYVIIHPTIPQSIIGNSFFVIYGTCILLGEVIGYISKVNGLVTSSSSIFVGAITPGVIVMADVILSAGAVDIDSIPVTVLSASTVSFSHKKIPPNILYP